MTTNIERQQQLRARAISQQQQRQQQAEQQEFNARIQETRQGQPAAPAQAPTPTGPLAPFVENGQIDLIKVAQSHDQQAINAAWQQYGKDTMSTAMLAAKQPVTAQAYIKAGPSLKPDLRVVTPVSLEQWNRALAANNTQFLLEHYPEAKGVNAAAASQLGPGVLGRTAQYEPSTWESLTPWAEEKGETATTARVLGWEANILKAAVPGYITVTQWDRMGTAEKAASVALDLLVVGSVARGIVRGGLRSLAPALRQSNEAKVVVQAAQRSGQAHAELQEAMTALRDVERVTLRGPGSGRFSGQAVLERVAGRTQGAPATTGRFDIRAQARETLQEHMSTVQRAAEASRRADEKLLDSLSSVKTLTEADIAKIQKLSGIKGLKAALVDVGKYQRQLAKQWEALEQWQKKHVVNLSNRPVAEEYTRRLTDIQETRTKLARAMVKYHEKVQPRVKHTPADEFKGWQMKWTEGGGGPAPETLADDYDRFLKRVVNERELKQLSADVRRKQSQLWEQREPSPVAAAEKPKARTGTETLELKPEYGPAKAPEVLEMRVPTIKAGGVRLEKVGLAMDRAAEISRMTPAAVSQATPAVVSQFYALRTIASAMGKPITRVDTAEELKTASQVNAQYQAAMLAGLEAAEKAYTNTMAGTDNESLAKINAEAAARAAINTAVQVQPKAQTQTKAATKVRTTVRTQARAAVSRIIKSFRGIPGPGDEIEIETVKGKPKKDAGAVSFPMGIVRVTVKPPYRRGKQDVEYTAVPVVRGRGSPERGVQVTRGEVPQLIRLSQGITRIDIRNGKHLSFSRDKSQRGPGILGADGKIHRQKRGTILNA